jgi:hypothetical protein
MDDEIIRVEIHRMKPGRILLTQEEKFVTEMLFIVLPF